MQLTPITWPRLATALAERVAGREPPGPWWRVAVDGAPEGGDRPVSVRGGAG